MLEIILKNIGIGGLIFVILLLVFIFAGQQIDKIYLKMQLDETEVRTRDLNLILIQYRKSVAYLIEHKIISIKDMKRLPESEITNIIVLLQEAD